MNKLPQSVMEIKALHQAGSLMEAEAAYLVWLAAHPEDTEALHALAMLYVELNQLDEAQSRLEQARQLMPEHPLLLLHLANVLKAKGLYDQALEILHLLLAAHPEFAAAHNNIGTVYYARGEWQASAQSFQLAIDHQPDYVDAYYNLGLALAKLGRRREALVAYDAVTALAPSHAGALFQSGSILAQLGDETAAAAFFNKVIVAHPFHLESQMNLAACLLRQGRVSEAKAHYLEAINISPAEPQALFNLGVIDSLSGNVKSAIDYYLRAVSAHPDYYEAHYNLAAAYLGIRHREDAALHFREALRLRPENEAVRHLLSILEQDKLLSSTPSAYLQTLFDSYADHYEPHLKSLGYNVPLLFQQLLSGVVREGRADKMVLDLGCGTGLCGEWLKSYARFLAGVDVSEKMLSMAAAKGCYDELVRAPIESFLRETGQQYDLIVAADVLVYFGQLEEVIAGVRRLLRRGGLFLLNLEISENEDFFMTSSGRFAHRKSYIDNLLAANSLSVLQYRVATLRQQDHQPVLGHLYLIQAVK